MPSPRASGRVYMRFTSAQAAPSTIAPQPSAAPAASRATANSTLGRVSAARSMPWKLSIGYSGFW